MCGDASGQRLEWDSEFFGQRIGRISGHRLTPAIIAHLNRWTAAEYIECLYFLADPDDDTTVRLAEENGFRLVDIRIALQCDSVHHSATTPLPAQVVIRRAHETDIAKLQSIARVSHRDTRFYHDEHFSRSRCDELYSTWIEKSCHGYADAVLVAELANLPVGYITCSRIDGDSGQIGLVAVAAGAQSQGVGRSLLAEALHWFAAANINRITVVTQGRNITAQRLYQRCGFVTDSVQLWYHRWCHEPRTTPAGGHSA